MPVADRAVVRSPTGHHAVNVTERALAGHVGHEPVCRPSRVGPLIEGVMDVGRQIDSPSVCELQHGPHALNKVDPAHRHRHATLAQEVRREAAAFFPHETTRCGVGSFLDRYPWGSWLAKKDSTFDLLIQS